MNKISISRLNDAVYLRAKNCVFAALAAVALSSCATEKTRSAEQPSKQEVSSAVAQAMNCIKVAITQLDDGVSSAETVGRIAVESCNAEVDAADQMSLRSTPLDPSEYSETAKEMRSIFTNQATSLVLKRRVTASGT